MRILFLSAVYPPEREPSAVMARELATALADRGHGVTVVSPFPNRSWGRVAPGYRRRVFEVRRQSFTHVMVPTWIMGPTRRAVSRVLEALSFGVAAAVAVVVLPRHDAVLLQGWPILGQLLPLIAARSRRVAVVNYVKDIYPEAAIAGGVIAREGQLARLLRWLDRLICRGAALNVVISDQMGDYLAVSRSIGRERFHTVHDWLDLSVLRPDERADAWREHAGISRDEFVCMFAGTMGLASGVRTLVDVARRLRDVPGITIVCVGDGVAKAEMEESRRREGLTHLRLLPFQPRESVAACQSAADVMLLTVRRGVGASSVPSKLITYLAMAKPVLCSVDPDSEIARSVRDRECGVVVHSEDSEAIAEAIVMLRNAGDGARRQMGARARRLAEEKYSLDRAVSAFEALLRGVSSPSVQPESSADNAAGKAHKTASGNAGTIGNERGRDAPSEPAGRTERR